ncbi:MAG: NAD-dependent epimerase/dehydratase family protein [Fimbriiglobus sp.]
MSVVLVTGAAGTMGRKLSEHLHGRCELRLIDRHAGPGIQTADLAVFGEWADFFEGVDTVVHLAADPDAYKPWHELVAPNVDLTIHVYQAAIQHQVRRVVFASSNHVMGGYQDDPDILLTDTTPPRPGLRYRVDGIPRSSVSYAHSKLFGERLGAASATSHGLETLAIRFGWIWRGGANIPANLPSERGEWFRLMWQSDRDYLHLMDRALEAELPVKFCIINGVSKNTGMKWDLEPGYRVGYQPQDDINDFTTAWAPSAGQ